MDMDILGAVASKNVSKAVLTGDAKVARHEVKARKKMAARQKQKARSWVKMMYIYLLCLFCLYWAKHEKCGWNNDYDRLWLYDIRLYALMGVHAHSE